MTKAKLNPKLMDEEYEDEESSKIFLSDPTVICNFIESQVACIARLSEAMISVRRQIIREPNQDIQNQLLGTLNKMELELFTILKREKCAESELNNLFASQLTMKNKPPKRDDSIR
jgi:hypothetical protein